MILIKTSRLKLFNVNLTLQNRLNNYGQNQSISTIPRVGLDWPEDKIIKTILQASKSNSPGFFYLENHGIKSSIFEVIYKTFFRVINFQVRIWIFVYLKYFQDAIHESNKFYTKLNLEEKLQISNHGYFGAPEGKSSKGKKIFENSF